MPHINKTINKKRVAIITGARSDYGLLRYLINKMKSSNKFELKLIASGMHFSKTYGETYREILNDGNIIDERVEMLVSGNSSLSNTKSMGIGLISFGEIFNRNKFDFVIILGDRFEALVAATAAFMSNTPIVHIHGGEVTIGSQDDAMRHAITKLSSLHFVAHEIYKKRVIQLGEHPKNVYVSGALGIENLKSVKKITKKSAFANIDFNIGDKNALLTYHPETNTSIRDNIYALRNIFKALTEMKNTNVLITAPNSDAYSSHLIKEIEKLIKGNSKFKYIKSLGYEKYIQLARHLDFMIGNSSSGILEAPFLKIPSINIGNRQNGRIFANSVISSSIELASIRKSIAYAMNPTKDIFDQSNIFGKGTASNLILKRLEKINFKNLNIKEFYDI